MAQSNLKGQKLELSGSFFTHMSDTKAGMTQRRG